MSLTILQKGLGLILLPLILQGAVFVGFYMTISKTEQLASQVTKQANLVQDLRELGNAFTSIWNTMITMALDTSSVEVGDADGYARRIEKQLTRLKAQSPSPLFSIQLARAETVSHAQVEALKAVGSRRFDDPTEARKMFKTIRPSLRLSMEQARRLDNLMTEEQIKLGRSQAEAADNRRNLNQALSCGIAFDIILTIALIAFFQKNISDRLGFLLINARRLTSQAALPGHIDGGDEIAYLDKILHEAEAELRKAALYRTDMTASLSTNLLTPVQSALEIAENLQQTLLTVPQLSDAAKTERHLQSLKRNLNRVSSLVQDHLTVEQLESGSATLHYSLFDLRQCVDEIIDGVAAQATLRAVQIINKVEGCQLEADRNLIGQVLANYLSNAIKYSPKGGGTIFVTAKRTGANIKVMVLDQGSGLDPAAQSKVFQRFQQNVDDGKSRQGYGLGLAICKQLIEYHQGRVGVTSSVGEGSTFWFVLPAKRSS